MIELKNEAKASMPANLTYRSINFLGALDCVGYTYIDAFVPKGLSKDFLNHILVLSLYYAGSCGEYSESAFPYTVVWRLT